MTENWTPCWFGIVQFQSNSIKNNVIENKHFQQQFSFYELNVELKFSEIVNFLL